MRNSWNEDNQIAKREYALKFSWFSAIKTSIPKCFGIYGIALTIIWQSCGSPRNKEASSCEYRENHLILVGLIAAAVYFIVMLSLHRCRWGNEVSPLLLKRETLLSEISVNRISLGSNASLMGGESKGSSALKQKNSICCNWKLNLCYYLYNAINLGAGAYSAFTITMFKNIVEDTILSDNSSSTYFEKMLSKWVTLILSGLFGIYIYKDDIAPQIRDINREINRLDSHFNTPSNSNVEVFTDSNNHENNYVTLS